MLHKWRIPIWRSFKSYVLSRSSFTYIFFISIDMWNWVYICFPPKHYSWNTNSTEWEVRNISCSYFLWATLDTFLWEGKKKSDTVKSLTGDAQLTHGVGSVNQQNCFEYLLNVGLHSRCWGGKEGNTWIFWHTRWPLSIWEAGTAIRNDHHSKQEKQILCTQRNNILITCIPQLQSWFHHVSFWMWGNSAERV